MKKFARFTGVILGLLMTVSFQATANEVSLAQADQLFQSRGPNGQGLENARQSAEMYGKIYDEAVQSGKDPLTKATILIKKSTALYYVADHAANNNEKIQLHGQGKDVGQLAASLLHKDGAPTSPIKEEYTQTLARAYYWLGANFGKWGLARGVVNSLTQWPELKKYMNYIKEELKQEDVEDYGANRILGYAYFKLPFPLGDSNKALQLLEEAYENTLDDNGELSIHGVNLVYYAEVLINKGQKAKAKEILTKFIALENDEEAIAQYNPARIPETKEEIEEAKDLMKKL